MKRLCAPGLKMASDPKVARIGKGPGPANHPPSDDPQPAIREFPSLMVNLGCGSRFHPDWVNLDLHPTSPHVLRADLSRGIPLNDASCQAVYSSHLLEHLRRTDVLPFLAECHRVLTPGGTIRIVVPDLERTCRDYLSSLEASASGHPSAIPDLQWMTIELLDQLVREQPGGEMARYLASPQLVNEEFVYQRIGEEGRKLVQHLQAEKISLGQRIRGMTFPRLAGVATTRVIRILRRILVRLVAGRTALRAFDIGSMRLGGEVHQWMYDRVTLRLLLIHSGFRDPVVRTADGSAIRDWLTYHLDQLPDGTVIKPDSLFMEATKT